MLIIMKIPNTILLIVFGTVNSHQEMLAKMGYFKVIHGVIFRSLGMEVMAVILQRQIRQAMIIQTLLSSGLQQTVITGFKKGHSAMKPNARMV